MSFLVEITDEGSSIVMQQDAVSTWIQRFEPAGSGGPSLYLAKIPDGTVIWTSPSGDAYVKTPGSALLFPSLCAPTGELTVPDVVVDDRCGEHTAMMRTRRRTRAQNRADRIAAERQQNQRARESTTTTAGGRVLRELPPRRRRRPAALLLESLLLTATKGIDISEAAVLTKLVLR